jgi:hypothetical protein
MSPPPPTRTDNGPAGPPPPAPDRRAAGAPPPLLFDTRDMCAVLRIGLATLHRLKAAGKLPRARKLAGLKWDADEVRRWVAAGMPALQEWEAMEAARLTKTK